MKLNDYKIINKIIDKNFKWEDVSSYKTSFVGNVYCPFHENHDSPAARLYYDEDNDWWILFCYTEKRAFHVHDYVYKILCLERRNYKTPLDFLRERMEEGEIIRQYKLIESEELDLIEDRNERKMEWIDNVYAETGNVVDYIEALYNA